MKPRESGAEKEFQRMDDNGMICWSDTDEAVATLLRRHRAVCEYHLRFFTGDVTHRSADRYPVTAGAKFWDNNLTVVQVQEVAVHWNDYQDLGEIQTWHSTTRGDYDTLSGSLQHIGRLVRFFEGLDAERYKPGTQYGDVKQDRR